MTATNGIDFSTHPCFSKEAHNKHGRVHLPVAPRCNIQCNFCNRKYDCANESRPGVTSHLMNPEQGVDYLAAALVLASAVFVMLFVFGPNSRARLGKLRTEMPKYASDPLDH